MNKLYQKNCRTFNEYSIKLKTITDAEILNTLFPTFQRLNNDIEAMQKFTPSKPEVSCLQVNTLTILSTKGKIKIYREGENGGEFFMYYSTGQAVQYP
jgi:CRP/FNR family transcriptional regulator